MGSWKRDLLKVLHCPTSKSHWRIFSAFIAIVLVALIAPALATAAGYPTADHCPDRHVAQPTQHHLSQLVLR